MSHPVPVRTARGFGAAAVAPHELSTLAAIEIMEGGGNAVDGAIAANAVQGTVAPETCGIGGSASALRDAGHGTMPVYGAPAVTVPGCVDGWHVL